MWNPQIHFNLHFSRHFIENYKKIFRGMEIPIKGNTWSETVSLLPKAIEISTQKTVYKQKHFVSYIFQAVPYCH